MNYEAVILAATVLPLSHHADILQDYKMEIWVPDFAIDPLHETTVYLGSWDSDALSPHRQCCHQVRHISRRQAIHTFWAQWMALT